MGVQELLILIVIGGVFAFHVVMFFDVFKHKQASEIFKLGWRVAIIFLPIAGAAAYYWTSYKKYNVITNP